MPRSPRSREINIFNFSFLDILACTIGALTFILVMVLLRPQGRVNTASMEESREELHEEVEALTASIAEAAKTAPGNEARSKETKEEISQMRRRLSALKGELEGDPSRNDKLAQNLSVLNTELQRKSEDAKEISKRIQALEQEIAGLTKQKLINAKFKIPRWHKTDKKEVYFECMADAVNVLDQWQSSERSDGEIDETPLPDPDPTPIARINDRGSHFAKKLMEMDTENEYAFFFVRPNGFDSFRAARQILWDRGFEVGWTPWSDAGQIVLTTGEGEEAGALGGGR